METRDILAIVGAVVTIAIAAGVARYQVAEHHSKLTEHTTSISDHENRLALVEQKQTWQATQIDGLVRDLREVVSALQKLAVDLAAMTGNGKKG